MESPCTATRSPDFGSKWVGSGIGRCRAVVRLAACCGTECGGLLTAGCPLRASVIPIHCAASASSPEARAGCGNPARPDPWRGLWATMIPTPTVWNVDAYFGVPANTRSCVAMTLNSSPGRISIETVADHLQGRVLRTDQKLQSPPPLPPLPTVWG